MSTKTKSSPALISVFRGKPAFIKPNVNIRALEDALRGGPQAEMLVSHTFTRDHAGKINLYTRGCLMRAGSLVISKIHNSQHPWAMLMGECWVYDGVKWKYYKGGHAGVTQPGSQRVLWIIQDTVWQTNHATDTDDLAVIESRIIQPHALPSPLTQRTVADLRKLLR